MSEKEELTLEEQVEQIRRRRNSHGSRDNVRRWLNIVYLTLAAIGLVWYFADEGHRTAALAVIGIAMLLKIVEFCLRIMG